LTPLHVQSNFGLAQTKTNPPFQARNNLNIKTTQEDIRPIKSKEEGITVPGSPLMIHDRDSCSYNSVISYMKSHFNMALLYKLEHESCGMKRRHKNVTGLEDENPVKSESVARTTPQRIKKVKLSTSPLLFNNQVGEVSFLQTPAKLTNNQNSNQKMEIENGPNKPIPLMKSHVFQDRTNLKTTEFPAFKSEEVKNSQPTLEYYLNKNKRSSFMSFGKAEEDYQNKENAIEIEI